MYMQTFCINPHVCAASTDPAGRFPPADANRACRSVVSFPCVIGINSRPIRRMPADDSCRVTAQKPFVLRQRLNSLSLPTKMRPRQTDTKPPSADVFSLFFFRERSTFFATFCTPRLGTIDIFACTNSRSLEEGKRERQKAPCFTKQSSRVFLFVTSPFCFPRVFLEQKATKISTESFFSFEDFVLYIYLYMYVKIFAANKYIKTFCECS